MPQDAHDAPQRPVAPPLAPHPLRRQHRRAPLLRPRRHGVRHCARRRAPRRLQQVHGRRRRGVGGLAARRDGRVRRPGPELPGAALDAPGLDWHGDAGRYGDCVPLRVLPARGVQPLLVQPPPLHLRVDGALRRARQGEHPRDLDGGVLDRRALHHLPRRADYARLQPPKDDGDHRRVHLVQVRGARAPQAARLGQQPPQPRGYVRLPEDTRHRQPRVAPLHHLERPRRRLRALPHPRRGRLDEEALQPHRGHRRRRRGQGRRDALQRLEVVAGCAV
mmetsp:Transcript_31625/g.100423  ORF Transcript_31625/g.100423 Transcript_31625/m.100423 type:complete len:277 (-) Transcript_31625:1000-1830(-)